MKFGILVFIIIIIIVTINQCTTNIPDIAFTDVNVIPMHTDTILYHQTVIVNKEKILKIGPCEKTKVSNKAIQIDGSGKFLMPGLVDMHTHVWNEYELVLMIANGVTTIRNMGGAPIHLEFKEKIRNGEILGPDIYTAGPVIDGYPAIWTGSVEVEGPYRARKVIDEQLNARYDFIKIYNNLSYSAFEAIMSISREYDIPVVGHVPFCIPLEKALESGISCIEHLEGYGLAIQSDRSPYANNTSFSMSLAWAYCDDRKIDNIVSQTIKSGVWNCPTMVVFHKIYISPEEVDKMLNRSEMKYVAPVIKQKWKNRNYSRIIASKSDQIYQARLKLLNKMHSKGANILLGTDSGNPFTVHGFSIHEELNIFIDAGYTPYEGLKAGTIDAARFLNTENKFGSVEVGHIASLLILEDNPFEDISNLSKISGVMIRGKWLSKNEINSKLQEIAKQFHSDLSDYLQ